MKILLTVIITIAVLIIIGIIFIYSGAYNVAAIEPEGKIGTWLFSTVMDKSVDRHSKGIEAPALDSQDMIDSGFQQFNRNCYGCHGGPGIKPVGAAKGMNPTPPDLAEGVSDLSGAQVFWIVKNGIKMTAMPAYGTILNDSQLWTIVAFVRLLPKMTPEQYQDYKFRLG